MQNFRGPYFGPDYKRMLRIGLRNWGLNLHLRALIRFPASRLPKNRIGSDCRCRR
ncbi:hypothetical protein Csa_011316 [Cucumis sativus]|uniref:Uncharacterized protein n=1 Tax=Cucumis sativus TaxID=3659 RepID=A0A0A0LA30_CUCSA|nr:hypothetical protein Csa_011316 [Cucumis sativus]